MQPTLFIGHGSPMNALGGNDYARSLLSLGEALPRPSGILVVSAHWQTEATLVSISDPPPVIYDFTGFPEELYSLKYPAPGAPRLVARVKELLEIEGSAAWGLDHGAWAVLRHLYPRADIPVTQLSLNRGASFADHLALAEKLKPLRQEGFLILGSGNIVHNLRRISWEENGPVLPWAQEFDLAIKTALLAHDFAAVAKFKGIDPSLVKLSVPTTEHYLPLLYAMGASESTEKIEFPFEALQNGSISMRSVRFG